MFDPNALLNLERRTGVKDEDIDSFVRKASEVERALKGLADGTLRPEDVKIEGIETDEEKAQKEREKEERRRKQQEQEIALRSQRKREERERWWASAEVFRPKTDESGKLSGSVMKIDEATAAKERLVSRYTMDYSKWNTWEPDDEVSKQEAHAREQEEEEKRNKEFESNNPEFCQQFMQDMEERKKATQKKQESADVLRLKGNRCFKSKEFSQALTFYMDALRSCPFDGKILLNIAQVHIKLHDLDDALEFLSRTLYLDPQNVKALSRQAAVHSERQHSAEALRSITLALAVEPTNVELLAQEKEIRAMDIEHKQQQALEYLKSKSNGSVASLSLSTASASAATSTDSKEKEKEEEEVRGMHLIDSLLSLLSAAQRDEEETLRLANALIPLLKAYLMLRVYFTTSNLLKSVITEIRRLKDAASQTAQEVTLLVTLLQLVAAAIQDQRSAKQCCLDEKLLTTVKSIVFPLPEGAMSLIPSALAVILAMCNDDSHAKARGAVFSDASLGTLLATTIGNLDCNLYEALAYKDNAEAQSLVLESISISLTLLKLILFSTDSTAQAVIVAWDSLSLQVMVSAVSCALHHAFQEMHSASPIVSFAQSLDRMELAIDVLVGLSRLEKARPAFAKVLPLHPDDAASSSSGSKKASKSAVKDRASEETPRSSLHVVVNVALMLPVFASNSLAILMNASLTPATATAEIESEEVKQILLRDGALELALSSLTITNTAVSKSKSMTVTETADESAEDSLLLARKAGLLSRMSSLSEVQSRLSKSDNYRLLIRRVVALSSLLASGNASEKKVLDELLPLVRVLASLTNPTNEHKSIGAAERLLPALLMLFPKPREECGEITPTSVTLMPQLLAGTSTAISAQLIGNASRCLIPYADDATFGAALYSDKSLLTIEKWVCAMATLTDMRVRKNIAILLAKACRMPGMREKVTHFRGLQMMIELQEKL